VDKETKVNRKLHAGILVVVIAIASFIGLNMGNDSLLDFNNTQENNDPYVQFRSDNLHIERESAIKEAFHEYMNYNFQQFYKTSWFDSVSATSTIINEFGTLFLIQSKGKEYDEQAKNYLGSAGYFFNDKTLDQKYRIDRLILVNQEYEVLKELGIVKW